MPTINQLAKKKRFSKKTGSKKTPALYSNPQKQGTCISVFNKTPRKPNSALRKVAKVRLVNSRIITVYIPGEGHNISRFSDVLISGRRVRDLPGIKYGALRGKLDLSCVDKKKNGRSKYGSKKEKLNHPPKPAKLKKKVKLQKINSLGNKLFNFSYLVFVHHIRNELASYSCFNVFYHYYTSLIIDHNIELRKKQNKEEWKLKYFISDFYKEIRRKLYIRRYKVLYVNKKVLSLKDNVKNTINYYNMKV